MILKELFTKVSFDNLLPYLKAYEKEHLDKIYSFREAYDRLQLMQPNKEASGMVHVEWCKGEVEGETRWIEVFHLNDDCWENELAKEILIGNDVNLPLEEIAMLCLWEITYYGFSPMERTLHFEEMFSKKKPANKYEVALDKLERSIWHHQISRRYRSYSPEYGCCTDAGFAIKHITNKKMNRSKRKREYRQDKRREYLELAIERQRIIDKLIVSGSSFLREELDFLYNITQEAKYIYSSVMSKNPLRYILESMTKYQQLDLSYFNSAVVAIYYPKTTPIEELQVKDFKMRVQEHLGYTDILFGNIACESEEVRVILLLNEK